MSRERLLFVDDEARVLEGLERLLHGARNRWEVSTALGAEAAIAMLAERPYDVVVSDMRMPGMDGASLLAYVHDKHPEVVRIVLSGQTDLKTALRTVTIAHQFLSKPCDVKALTEVIEGAQRVRAAHENEAVRRAVGGVRALPTLPSACQRLGELLAREDVTMAEIAAEVEKDVGLVAKIMQLVNSPFFGLRRRPGCIKDAVAYLGLNVVRNVVLAVGALTAFEDELARAEIDLDDFQRRALRTAALAKRIAPAPLADQAFTAGMLHDVGKLVLATRTPDAYFAAVREAREAGRALLDVEREKNGFTHADAGAMLVGLWGFPWLAVEAVAHHGDACGVPHATFGVMDAVYVASVLVNGDADGLGDVPADYAAALGVGDRLPEWRALALELGVEEAA